jgi:O-antigen ligase
LSVDAAPAAPPALRRGLLVLLVLLAIVTSAIAVANIVLGIALLVWIVTLRREGRFRAPFQPAIVFWVGIFVACGMASAVFSLHPRSSLVAIKGSFTYLVLPLFVDALASEREVRRVVAALGGAGVVLALIGFWQYFHGANRLTDRIEGTLSHYMTFSGLLLVVALLFAGIALEGRRRVAASAVVLIVGGAILMTFTRNAYVGFFGALLLYLAIRRPKWLPAVPVLAAAVYLAAPGAIRARIVSTFDPADPTNRDRIDMAVAGARMIRDFPVFGLGLGLVKPYYPLYRVPDALRWRVPHLHDNLLQIAAESGLIAAGAYVAILACFFSACIRALARERDPERRGLLAGAFLAVTGITIAGFFEYNFGDVEVLMTTLIVMAIPFTGPFRRSLAREIAPEAEAPPTPAREAGAGHE